MKKNNIEGWLFVSPLVIWISLIILVPIYIAFELSLFNVKIIGTSGKFVGIDNYIKLLGKSKFLNAFLKFLSGSPSLILKPDPAGPLSKPITHAFSF